MVFWYGSMVWGLLPFDFEVSFEAHITGAISGLVLALVYRDQGPEPERSELDDEDEPGEGQHEEGQPDEAQPDEGPSDEGPSDEGAIH